MSTNWWEWKFFLAESDTEGSSGALEEANQAVQQYKDAVRAFLALQAKGRAERRKFHGYPRDEYEARLDIQAVYEKCLGVCEDLQAEILDVVASRGEEKTLSRVGDAFVESFVEFMGEAKKSMAKLHKIENTPNQQLVDAQAKLLQHSEDAIKLGEKLGLTFPWQMKYVLLNSHEDEDDEGNDQSEAEDASSEKKLVPMSMGKMVAPDGSFINTVRCALSGQLIQEWHTGEGVPRYVCADHSGESDGNGIAHDVRTHNCLYSVVAALSTLSGNKTAESILAELLERVDPHLQCQWWLDTDLVGGAFIGRLGGEWRHPAGEIIASFLSHSDRMLIGVSGLEVRSAALVPRLLPVGFYSCDFQGIGAEKAVGVGQRCSETCAGMLDPRVLEKPERCVEALASGKIRCHRERAQLLKRAKASLRGLVPSRGYSFVTYNEARFFVYRIASAVHALLSETQSAPHFVHVLGRNSVEYLLVDVAVSLLHQCAFVGVHCTLDKKGLAHVLGAAHRGGAVRSRVIFCDGPLLARIHTGLQSLYEPADEGTEASLSLTVHIVVMSRKELCPDAKDGGGDHEQLEEFARSNRYPSDRGEAYAIPSLPKEYVAKVPGCDNSSAVRVSMQYHFLEDLVSNTEAYPDHSFVLHGRAGKRSAVLGKRATVQWKGDEEDQKQSQEEQKDDALFTLLYTSGSSGFPKGVRITESVFYEDTCQYRTSLHPYINVSYIPLSHSSDRMRCWHALVNGGRVGVAPYAHISWEAHEKSKKNVLIRTTSDSIHVSPQLEQLFECVKQISPCAMACPPRIWTGLYRYFNAQLANKTVRSDALAAVRQLFGDRLHTVCTGGGATPGRIMQWIREELFPAQGENPYNFHESYGATECGGICEDEVVMKNVCVCLIPNKERGIRLFEEKSPQDPSQSKSARFIGEVVVCTRSIAAGYWDNATKTRASFVSSKQVEALCKEAGGGIWLTSKCFGTISCFDGALPKGYEDRVWFRTADLCSVDLTLRDSKRNVVSQRLSVLERVNSVYTTDTGVLISPVQVEMQLESLPDVRGAFVHVCPREEDSKRSNVVAVVVPTEKCDVGKVECTEFVSPFSGQAFTVRFVWDRTYDGKASIWNEEGLRTVSDKKNRTALLAKYKQRF